MPRWSIRPLTSPSGILDSSTRGGLGICAEPGVGSVMPARSRIVRANMTPLALGDVDLSERRFQAFGELLRVVIRPEMHEEQPRLVVEHVVVECGNLDPVLAQCLGYRVHLL